MERCFNRNQEAVFAVRDYLLSRREATLRYDHRLQNEGGMMQDRVAFAQVEFSDDRVREAMDTLIRRGYRSISKENDFIVFERWSIYL